MEADAYITPWKRIVPRECARSASINGPSRKPFKSWQFLPGHRERLSLPPTLEKFVGEQGFNRLRYIIDPEISRGEPNAKKNFWRWEDFGRLNSRVSGFDGSSELFTGRGENWGNDRAEIRKMNWSNFPDWMSPVRNLWHYVLLSLKWGITF